MAEPGALFHGRSALILYGSETGNAQDVAEELGRICERLRFETQVAELNDIDLVCKDTLAMINIESFPFNFLSIPSTNVC